MIQTTDDRIRNMNCLSNALRVTANWQRAGQSRRKRKS